ncbi:MAG: sodium:solute symporter family protein, partial [Bacteroidales bacterium]|nr:sodium:solute symporter family protein [Bacteroidales bacterium]
MFRTPVLILCFIYFAFLIGVSAYSSKQAGKSFTAFAIGGGALPVIYVIFTSIAAQFGSGNFIGHGDAGYIKGLSWLPFVIGEQFALAIFAFLFATFHKYNYNTLSEFCDRRITRDNVTRAIIGVLIALPCLAWVGGQAMGLGFLFNQLTGINSDVIVVLAGAVFIIYGALGGILGIARVDLVQGILIIFLGIFFYINAFDLVNFNLGTLQERIVAINPDMWSFSSVAPVALFSAFITGTFGTLSFQPFWQ